MKISIGSIILRFVFITALLSGCAPASTPVQPKTIEESQVTPLIANLTGKSEYPAIAFDKSGETLVIMGGDNNGGISGAIWDSPQRDTIVVYTDENHLPNMLVIGDYVLVFTNYTNSTVDITVISSDGSTESFPLAQLDQNYYQKIRNAQIPNKKTLTNISFKYNNTLDNDELWHYIKLGSLSLGTAACVSGVILTAGITVALSVACAGVLIKAITMEQEQYNKDRITPLEAADVSLDVFNCAVGSSAADCLDVIIDARNADHQDADTTINANQEIVNNASSGVYRQPPEGNSSQPPECAQLNLLPEECANLGSHDYLLTAKSYDPCAPGWDDPIKQNLTITFNSTGVTMHLDSNYADDYIKIETNNYYTNGVENPNHDPAYGDYLTFSLDGFVKSHLWNNNKCEDYIYNIVK